MKRRKKLNLWIKKILTLSLVFSYLVGSTVTIVSANSQDFIETEIFEESSKDELEDVYLSEENTDEDIESIQVDSTNQIEDAEIQSFTTDNLEDLIEENQLDTLNDNVNPHSLEKESSSSRKLGTGLIQLWQVVPDGQQYAESTTTSAIMNQLKCRPNHNLYPISKGSSHTTYVNSCYVDDALYLGEDDTYYHIYVSGFEGKVKKSESHYFDLDLNKDGKTVKYEIQTVAYFIPDSGLSLLSGDEDIEAPLLSYSTDYLDKYNDQEIELLSDWQVQSPSFYRNENGTLIHYLSNNIRSYNNYSKSIVGKAPDCMNQGVNYYSYDGIYFYENWQSISVDGAGSINSNNPFYNYYQYLPFRSTSNYDASTIDNYTNSKVGGSNSKLLGTGDYFYNVQNLYGINGVLQYAMGIHESGWGKSSLSLNKNNLFGMNAVDSNPYGSGTSFPTVESGINYHADRYLSWGYTDPIDDDRYFGPHIGNKGSGMNVKYASDPFWGEKIAGWYYQIDSANGFKDYNYYSIGVKETSVIANVRSSATTSGNLLYQTKNKKSNLTIKNYPVLLVGQENNYYKIKTDTPIVNGVPKYSGKYDWNTTNAFIVKDVIRVINHSNFISPNSDSIAGSLDLKSIDLNIGTLEPSFNKDITEYEVNLPSGTKSITIDAKPESASVTVTGIGGYNLVPGRQTVKITVTNTSNKTKNYTININVAKEIVNIPDLNLKKGINKALGQSETAEVGKEDLLQLKVLDLSNLGIKDLTGLGLATNLTELILSNNQIQDLYEIGKLDKLLELNLSNNLISDIETLNSLKKLKKLDLSNNNIMNLSVSTLSSVSELNVNHQEIKLEVVDDFIKGMSLTIDNPIQFLDREISILNISEAGTYDSTTNQLIWKNIKNESLMFEFKDQSNVFSGTVVIPLNFSIVKHTGWLEINGVWYYFNAEGHMLTGWQTINGQRYYFNTDGKMQTHWYEENGVWYYFNAEGHMLTGWQTINGQRYYFNTDGKMQTHWYEKNGVWYYFNGEGHMLTGWQTINGQRYYFNTDGKMQTHWYEKNGVWYYFNGEGHMLTGWQTINGQRYYFNTDGKMQTHWYEENGVWYYFNAEGHMLTGWQTINGQRYYFNTDGKMQTHWYEENGVWYYFNAEGHMLTGWQTINGQRYYFNTDGKMQTHWYEENGVWYYFNAEGHMLTGWQTINGQRYYFNTDGKMQTYWYKENGVWYYFNGEGHMLTRWQTINGQCYYFNTDGKMQTHWYEENRVWYYFNGEGHMLTGWQTINGQRYYFNTDGKMQTGWQTIDGVKYYFNELGHLQF